VSGAPTDLLLDTKAESFYISNQDGTLARFDWKSGNGKFFSGKGHGKAVKAIALSGDHVVTAGFDDRLRLSSKSSDTFSTDAVALGGQPTSVAAGHKDHTLLAVGLANSKLVLLKGGEIKATLDISFVPTSVSFGRDDSHLVVGGKDKKVHFYHVTGSGLTADKEYKESDKEVTLAHYNPEGSLLATIDKDKRIYFYNKEGKNLNPLGWEYHAATVTHGAWSPSGARYATGSADESIIIWSDFKKFSEDTRLHIKDAHSQGVELVAFWDENTLISVGSDRSVKIWELPALKT